MTDPTGRQRARWKQLGLAVAVLASGCAGPDILDEPVIIGLSTDSPGLGFQDPRNNQRSGFDVDVARWLGGQAGFMTTETDVNVDAREDFLRSQGGDLVIAVYTITDDREKSIDFAGPYMLSFQSVMVRADNPTQITAPAQLRGLSVCAQVGSTSVAELRAITGVAVVERIGLNQCVSELLSKGVDAVSTDELLLRGYARTSPGLRVLDVQFGALQKYGIGLRPEPGTANCELIRNYIKSFIVSGAWTEFFRNNFGDIDPLEYRPDPNALRECVADVP